MNAGNKLKEFRKNKGFTQDEFSKELKCDRSFLAAIEVGRDKLTYKFQKRIQSKYHDWDIIDTSEFVPIKEPSYRSSTAVELKALRSEVLELKLMIEQLLNRLNDSN